MKDYHINPDKKRKTKAKPKLIKPEYDLKEINSLKTQISLLLFVVGILLIAGGYFFQYTDYQSTFNTIWIWINYMWLTYGGWFSWIKLP